MFWIVRSEAGARYSWRCAHLLLERGGNPGIAIRLPGFGHLSRVPSPNHDGNVDGVSGARELFAELLALIEIVDFPELLDRRRLFGPVGIVRGIAAVPMLYVGSR